MLHHRFMHLLVMVVVVVMVVLCDSGCVIRVSGQTDGVQRACNKTTFETQAARALSLTERHRKICINAVMLSRYMHCNNARRAPVSNLSEHRCLFLYAVFLRQITFGWRAVLVIYDGILNRTSLFNSTLNPRLARRWIAWISST